MLSDWLKIERVLPLTNMFIGSEKINNVGEDFIPWNHVF